MRDSYYFISDIHLGLLDKKSEQEREKTLVRFLKTIKENAIALFIVGDLYDYWFEYRRVYQKGFFKTLAAFSELTEAGVQIYYIIGNHDFMHRDFFEKEIGVKLIPDFLDIILDKKRFYIAHGDGLVKNDLGYKILKKILRNNLLQFAYSLIHPDLGIAIASRTSKKSREYTTQKDYGEDDGLFDSAKSKIDAGFEIIVFGHLHQRMYKNYHNGLYINLGTWLSVPCYGQWKNGNFTISDIISPEN